MEKFWQIFLQILNELSFVFFLIFAQIIEMDTEMGVTWIDWEVWKYFLEDKEAQQNAQAGPEEITLDAEFLKQIWKPDIFIGYSKCSFIYFNCALFIKIHFIFHI